MHLPCCIAICITTYLGGTGHYWRARRDLPCDSPTFSREEISSWAWEKRSSTICDQRVLVNGFLTDSNSHWLYQRFGRRQPESCPFSFLWVGSPSVSFRADGTTVAFSGAEYHFLAKLQASDTGIVIAVFVTIPRNIFLEATASANWSFTRESSKGRHAELHKCIDTYSLDLNNSNCNNISIGFQ